MSIINSSAMRSVFNLNVSSKELNEMEKLNLVKVSNSTISRFEKTLRTSNDGEKCQRIKEKLVDVKYGDIFAKHQEQTRQEVGDLGGMKITQSRLKEMEKKNVLASPKTANANNTEVKSPTSGLSKEKMLKSFQLLGVNITSWPDSYHELFSSIKSSLSESVSNVLKQKFKDIEGEGKLQPKRTQNILHTLSKSPECLTQIARHFDGKFEIQWSQGKQLLQQVQLGKAGLCAPLAMKWCADKNQGVPFFEDMKSREGLEEVMNLKLAGNNALDYLNSRGLTSVAITDAELNFQLGEFHLIGLDPVSKGFGHQLAAQSNENNQQHRFFDPNFGEFSFSSSENMKSFIQNFSDIYYPDLKVPQNMVFNKIQG